MRLEGKIAAITGAGRGIGLAAARLFAAEGARVAILEIDETCGRQAQESICSSGGEAHWIHTDVAQAESVRLAFEDIRSRMGGLHTIYNNASIFLGVEDRPIGEVPPSVWERILAVNLNGLYYTCRYGIPLLLASGGGSIIHTASSAALIGIPGCDAYTAAKGATLALTRSMAVEYGPRNIRVNCIAPAAIDTDMLRESSLDNPAFDEQAFFRSAPLGRFGRPEEIAQIALFLASDASSYLNGAVLVADGGITIT